MVRLKTRVKCSNVETNGNLHYSQISLLAIIDKYGFLINQLAWCIKYCRGCQWKKIALQINDCADDWTAKVAIIVSNGFITVRKRSFYTCLSVIVFTGGSAWVHAGIHPPWADTPWTHHLPQHTPPQADIPRTHHPQADTLPCRRLLECNLVSI